MSRNPHARQGLGSVGAIPLTVLALCVGLNMLDGFDVLAMSFAASGVKAEWHLRDAELGALLSAGLVGMGLGSLILGPCADRFGRRPVVLLSVALAGVGMLASALARDHAGLLLLRAITGVGIGGTIASVAVIVSESVPERWRGTALAVYAAGYSIGATVGGALATAAIPRYGWRAAFVVGGVMSLLTWPLARARLPESRDFLMSRGFGAGVRRVDAGPDPADPPHARQPSRASTFAQLRLLMRPRTLLVWTVFFCTMASFYFILSWTPRLLNAAGLSARQGMTGGVLLNLGGIAGCGLFALAAARADTHRLLFATLLGCAGLVVLFGLVLGRLDAALWTASLLGIIANAAMAGLYAVGPPLYPAAARTTGMGWAIGIGRFGAILAPLASGALLDRGWLPAQLYFFFSAPFLVAAVAIFIIGPARASAADRCLAG